MLFESLLKELPRTKVIIELKDFLEKCSKLNLEILDIHGNSVLDPSSDPEPVVIQGGSSPSKRLCGKNDCRFLAQCHRGKIACVGRSVITRQQETFICFVGYRAVCVPILYEQEVLGFFYVLGEGSHNLSFAQIKSITSFINQMAEQVIKELFNRFPDFFVEDLTPHQILANKIEKDIKQHYHKPDLSLRDISDRNAVSYHHLSRIFRKEFKTTFSRYRNKVRLEAASKLLRNRGLSVTQVSGMCGFDDAGYFCKVFKEAFGCSPLGFKEKNKRIKKRF